MWFVRVSAVSCHLISHIRVGMKAVPSRGDDRVLSSCHLAPSILKQPWGPMPDATFSYTVTCVSFIKDVAEGPL